MPAMPQRILSHVPVGALARLVEEFPEIDIVQIPTNGEIPPGAAGEVLLTFTWGSANMNEAVKRGVRWIHTLGTGIDRFPVDVLGDRILTCARGASATPMAEWTLAVMLAFEKQLPDAWVTEPPEHWNMAQLGGLNGKILALVGLGGIGEAIAQRALPFGMRVRAVRRTDRPSPLPAVELARDLDDLLMSADHLVLAAPATRATRHLIGREALSKLKAGAHLVNLSRGALIDQEALREALDDGRVARASLDVADPEPLPAGHWLYAHPRVHLSPHVSWSMPGALDEILETFAENLRRCSQGENLVGVVDLEAGY